MDDVHDLSSHQLSIAKAILLSLIVSDFVSSIELSVTLTSIVTLILIEKLTFIAILLKIPTCPKT